MRCRELAEGRRDYVEYFRDVIGSRNLANDKVRGLTKSLAEANVSRGDWARHNKELREVLGIADANRFVLDEVRSLVGLRDADKAIRKQIGLDDDSGLATEEAVKNLWDDLSDANRRLREMPEDFGLEDSKAFSEEVMDVLGTASHETALESVGALTAVKEGLSKLTKRDEEATAENLRDIIAGFCKEYDANVKENVELKAVNKVLRELVDTAIQGASRGNA